MCKWYRTEDSETAGGNPTQWYTDDGMQYKVAFIRKGGPGDEEMPRRVCALKNYPHLAEREALMVLGTVDPSYKIISRVEAGVAERADVNVRDT